MEIGPLVSEKKIFEGFLPFMGVVTQMLRTKFRSPYPRRLHIKFGFDLPRGFFFFKKLLVPGIAFICKKVHVLDLNMAGTYMSVPTLGSNARLRRRCLSIVDGWADDGQTPDHGYTIRSPMSLRLRWAKKWYKNMMLKLRINSATLKYV